MKKLLPFLLLLLSVGVKSQGVSTYGFSQSTEVYAPVIGTNSSATGDDGTQNAIPIGFTFQFGAIPYTTFSISTNGFIRLGSNIAAQGWVNALGNAAVQQPLIAPFWDDNNRGGGSIQYLTSGTSPNRVLEVSWDNINIGGGGTTSATNFASYKLRLSENDGKIEFIYSNTMNSAGTLSASIGINDSNSFASVTPAAGTATISSSNPYNAISTTVDLIGKKFTFQPLSPCSGTPSPGAAISTVSNTCANVFFTLSIPPLPSAQGYTYQWQSSANGTTFNNILNATALTLTTSFTADTYYRINVTCSGATGTSAPVLVSLTPPAQCYCFPTYSNGKTDGDLISNVSITGTTLANNSGNAPVNPSYTFFTGQPNYTATLQAGNLYQMNVTVGTYAQQNVAAWIDYNDDREFTEDEKIGVSIANVAANATATFNILLSCEATAGVHRMRIRDVWNNDPSSIDPCENYGYGEVEDYDITIAAASTCQVPFLLSATNINSSSAVLNWTSGCTATSWDVHVTATGGGLPTGAPSNPNVTTGFLATSLAAFTVYDFYVRSHCGAEVSDYAGPFTFTTLPEAVPNDDCTSATLLTVGTDFNANAIIATNAGATTTNGIPAPTCATFGFGGDVWFKAVVPADGAITIETNSNPGSVLIDTGMTVFSGDCTNLTAMGCSDDDGEGGFSKLSYTGLVPGSTIYARVWEYANDTFGTFRVSAWSASLANSSFSKSKFALAPNPVKDILSISMTAKANKIMIYNVFGQLVKEQSCDSDKINVNVANLPTGTYVVRVFDENGASSSKFIKQ